MPPDIVIVNPDQMHWDYTSCYGYPFISTQIPVERRDQ